MLPDRKEDLLEKLDRFSFVPSGGQSHKGLESKGGTTEVPAKALAKRSLYQERRSTTKKDLYVMTSSAFPGLVKVGRSNHPERRRLDLSNGQPVHYTLDVIFHDSGDHESEVHHQLEHVRHRDGYSREWFACTPDEVVEAFRVVAPNKIEQIERRTIQVKVLEEA